MLLKLPIILSSNFFFIPSTKYPTISLIYIAMVKLQYILLIHEVQKNLWWFSQSAKGTLVNYAVMDTNNIALWVSVCVRSNARFCFGSILKLYGKLIKVGSESTM